MHIEDREAVTMGRIYQISVSPGGVPKLPVTSTHLNELGLDGDAHSDTRHHGGPNAAVCLYSLERIRALQTEGHPIQPGWAGENLTLSRVDWSLMVPGVRLQIGDVVWIELTQYTIPCRTIQGAFADGNSRRIFQDTNPGWSRLYAKVLQTGYINAGDPVRVYAAEVAAG